MKRSILTLLEDEHGNRHAIFKTNHGRIVYLSISAENDLCSVLECFYLDRSTRMRPKNQVSNVFRFDYLLNVIREELDKDFADYSISEQAISKEEYIARHLGAEKKKILLVLKSGNVLKTCFKNRHRRAILLEITLSNNHAVISGCRYCDTRSECGEKQITPQGLVSIYFDYTLGNLLRLVNAELEGGFTDVMVSEENTVILDRPICGRI
jgi:hypothetical protein